MATQTEKTPRRKRKPLGPALPPAADVGAPTAAENAELITLWDTYAPEIYRGMMNAENKLLLEQIGKTPSGRYVWDETTMSYTNVETGHVVDQDEALYALSQFIKAYSKA